MEERVQKIMAAAGIGSRRQCDQLIAEGRVTVNGKLAILGAKADPDRDQIMVDGKLLRKPEPKVYIALNKPRGVLSTVDAPDPRRTVRDLVSVPETVYPVGRLDVESEGLILLTNDGDLADRLTHPRYGHEKEYRVLVSSLPDEKQLSAWRHGVVLEDGFKTSPAQVMVDMVAGKGAWLNVVMKEGHKRQIRATAAQIGLHVVRIVRVRIGTLRLGRLKSGEWRNLTQAEVTTLKSGTNAPAQPRNRSRNRIRSLESSSRPRSSPRLSPSSPESPGRQRKPPRAPKPPKSNVK
jgi:23S rRNA pseudouridine2605 synthase